MTEIKFNQTEQSFPEKTKQNSHFPRKPNRKQAWRRQANKKTNRGPSGANDAAGATPRRPT